MAKAKRVHVKERVVNIFRQDLVHAGEMRKSVGVGKQEEANIRMHVYVDFDKSTRADNTTFFLSEYVTKCELSLKFPLCDLRRSGWIIS